jgi:ATP-dependent Clp protease ATP-binding subunit ClpA
MAMIAVELEIVLHRMFVAARKARHRFVTPEHLLFQLLDRKAVVEHLEANAVRVASLKVKLRDHLARAPAFPPTVTEPDTEPTLEFQKTMQRAILGAQAEGRREVTVLDVLPALLDSSLGLTVTKFLRGSAAPASFAGLGTTQEPVCALCGAVTTPGSWTPVEGRGVLCSVCVEAVLAARRVH